MYKMCVIALHAADEWHFLLAKKENAIFGIRARQFIAVGKRFYGLAAFYAQVEPYHTHTRVHHE